MSIESIQSDMFTYYCDFCFTLGLCDALPLIFLGTPRVSKEWLRTLMALYKKHFRGEIIKVKS